MSSRRGSHRSAWQVTASTLIGGLGLVFSVGVTDDVPAGCEHLDWQLGSSRGKAVAKGPSDFASAATKPSASSDTPADPPVSGEAGCDGSFARSQWKGGKSCAEPRGDLADRGCQSAFALGQRRFRQLTKGARWGWSIGPLQEGVLSTLLVAGAGDGELREGHIVGQLHVEIDEPVLVTFDLDEGYGLLETHLHVGQEALPRNPRGDYHANPSRFEHVSRLDGATRVHRYELTGGSDQPGDLFVAAHAVVCALDPGEAAEAW